MDKERRRRDIPRILQFVDIVLATVRVDAAKLRTRLEGRMDGMSDERSSDEESSRTHVDTQCESNQEGEPEYIQHHTEYVPFLPNRSIARNMTLEKADEWLAEHNEATKETDLHRSGIRTRCFVAQKRETRWHTCSAMKRPVE